MKTVPAILISEELKRKSAKEAVLKAIDAINRHGPLAGVSDRSMYEFRALSTFINREVTVEEPRSEDFMDRRFAKREF